tara:strand:+ start:3708 stop:3995 length:288 start_codon:yes stop_codon:yes gene_type:complete
MNNFKNKELDFEKIGKLRKDQIISKLKQLLSEYNDLGWREDDAKIALKKQSEYIEGLNVLNKVLKARLDYWIADFMDQKQSYINVCVGADLKLTE